MDAAISGLQVACQNGRTLEGRKYRLLIACPARNSGPFPSTQLATLISQHPSPRRPLIKSGISGGPAQRRLYEDHTKIDGGFLGSLSPPAYLCTGAPPADPRGNRHSGWIRDALRSSSEITKGDANGVTGTDACSGSNHDPAVISPARWCRRTREREKRDRGVPADLCRGVQSEPGYCPYAAWRRGGAYRRSRRPGPHRAHGGRLGEIPIRP